MFILLILLSLGLYGCSSSKSIVHYASENTISINYSAYDYAQTVTAEAIDIAIRHSASYGIGMKLVSSNAVSPYSTEEINTFLCDENIGTKRIEVQVSD